jgi:UDP-N-acetylmuramyl tripeptide synthase
LIEDKDEAINQVIRMVKEGTVVSTAGKGNKYTSRYYMHSRRWKECFRVCKKNKEEFGE